MECRHKGCSDNKTMTYRSIADLMADEMVAEIDREIINDSVAAATIY